MAMSVSVVIPTHNRCEQLKQTIEALCQQSFDAAKMEVIVALDNCQDGSFEMIEQFDTPFNCFTVSLDGVGPAAARNAAAAKAQGDLLVFLDDDISVTPEWAMAHANAHKESPGRLVIGKLPMVDESNDSLFRRTLRLWWSSKFDEMEQAGYLFSYRDVITGNMSISAESFHLLNGFDEQLRIHEDQAFGLKAIEQDIKIGFEPSALGYHHDKTDFARAVKRKVGEGEADVMLGKLYPNVIPTMSLYSLYYHMRRPSRALFNMQFSAPILSDYLIQQAKRLLPVLEKFHLTGLWQRVTAGILTYAYWQGVVLQLQTQSAVKSFVETGDQVWRASSEANPQVASIDLTEGLAVAQEQLNQHSAENILLKHKGVPLAWISKPADVEHLGGRHLPSLLLRHVEPRLLFNMLFETSEQGIRSRRFGEPVKHEKSV